MEVAVAFVVTPPGEHVVTRVPPLVSAYPFFSLIEQFSPRASLVVPEESHGATEPPSKPLGMAGASHPHSVELLFQLDAASVEVPGHAVHAPELELLPCD